MSREIGRSIGGMVTMARHGDELRRRASAARLAKFEAQVDPSLPPGERQARAELLQRAHMRQLALRSAANRRTRNRKPDAPVEYVSPQVRGAKQDA